MSEKLDLEALKEAGVQIDDAEFTEEKAVVIMPKDAGAFLDLQPLYDTKKPDNGKYRLDQKCEVVVIMQAYIDVNDMSLELEPDFTAVSELLGHKTATLRNWWARREMILEAGRAYVQNLKDVHALKLFMITQKVEEEMLNKDLSQVSFKDLAMGLKTLTVVRRVGEDGGNVKKVEHSHRISFVRPGSEG